MRHGTIDGIEKPVSRLVLGVLDHTDEDGARAMLDAFFERGGNAIDTAWIYRSGEQERQLGRWLEARGARAEAVVVAKGAHTPHCTPYAVSRQLVQSLDRLRSDYVDLYLLHRDNEDVPVGEFVDVLNRHRSAGRIRAFGVSNWTIARVEAANAYASANGLSPVAALSNQFSLARMVATPWAGALSAGDGRTRPWLEATQLPLLAWSSQARGFFARADRAALERLRVARLGRVLRRRLRGPIPASWRSGWERDEFIRCWYSRENFRRLERAHELAAERGITAADVALAYVLAQAFPTFAIIGPATIDELDASVAAVAVELSPDEVEWLDGRAARRGSPAKQS